LGKSKASIGYTFKLNNSSIKALDVSLYGRNLALWTKVPHIDPESSSFLELVNAQDVSFPATIEQLVESKFNFKNIKDEK
jgi:hypothetical protein